MVTTHGFPAAPPSRFGRSARALILKIALVVGASPAAAGTIGVTMVPPEAFFQLLRDGMQERVKAHPGQSMRFAHAETGNGAKQIEQIKAFIRDKVDALIVLPVEAAATKEITRLAQEADIPLVYVNNGPREDWFAGRVALALPNDLVAGRLQMTMLAQMMNGQGRLAIIRGPASHSASALRTQGVKEVLADFAGITVVEEAPADWDRKQAAALVSRWLANGRKIDAIAANNDEMAMGAADALEAAKIPLGQILIGGVDGTRDGIAAMHRERIHVTVFQDAALEGGRAVDDAVKLIRHEPVQQYDWIPFDLVTDKTLPRYLGMWACGNCADEAPRGERPTDGQ
ncbi:substrate-binding domain-containing protein [Methylobacterium sp. J-030]|uniref:substrate-binding domain-containing protein n=1 Tax=Methylobacterium sp. J-030 TaxID=2836627 RepID=UPI001FBB5B70|nr:substrate-binding domain-containing protein [Methylobacterium sp. J-030]MCJ2072652.1 substrate-binding domain-containing protein [Methylobacterium sp. J-030]